MYSKRIDWCGVVVALFLALSVVAMSVLAFLPLTSQNVCFADSSNGIVEDNLLLNNDCSTWSYQPSGSGNDKVLWSTSDQTFYVYTGYGLTVNANTFVAPNTTDLQRIYYVVTGLTVGQTYTFTYYMSSSQGEYRIRVYQDGTNLYSNYNQTAGIISYTFTCTYSVVRLFAQFRGTATIDWFKLELGSSFTGYVPKDYEHYGYNEGYNAGLAYGLNNYQIKSGFSLIGNADSRFVKNQASAMADGVNYIETWSATGTLSPVNYYDFTFSNPNGNVIQFCRSQFIGGSLTAYPSGSYEIYVNASGLSNVASCWSLGTFIYDSFNFYLFGNLSRSDIGLLIVQSNDSSNVRLYAPNYNYNFGDVKAFKITGLTSGFSYDFYLVKIGYSNINTFGVLGNTALEIYGESVLTGYGYYALYAEVNSYEVGVNAYDRGYNNGYNVGYSSGYQQGDNAGYNRGVDESSDYGFYGLIGSAIDVPINAITGLLDFDLLGVNMKAFFLSIFSLAVLIVIVRLIVGGLS